MDRGLGLLLGQLGKAVEYVHRFVLPATLLAGLRIVSNMDSGHLEVGDGGEEGVEEAGLV